MKTNSDEETSVLTEGSKRNRKLSRADLGSPWKGVEIVTFKVQQVLTTHAGF